MVLGGGRDLDKVAAGSAEREEFIEEAKGKLREELEKLVPTYIEALENGISHLDASNQLQKLGTHQALLESLTRDEKVDLHNAIDTYADLVNKRGPYSSVDVSEIADARKEIDEFVTTLDDARARLAHEDPRVQELDVSALGKRFKAALIPHVELNDSLERFSKLVFGVALRKSPLMDLRKIDEAMTANKFSDYEKAGKKNDAWTIGFAIAHINEEFVNANPKHPYDKDDMRDFLEWMEEQGIKLSDLKKDKAAVDALTKKASEGATGLQWVRSLFMRGA